MGQETLLELRGLTKHFGAITAVEDMTFSVERGEVLGFLGPNGAGKSTTMKMITGFLTPSAGTALVEGFDVRRAPLEVKSRVGYLPEGAPLYGEMTPAALLRFVAELRGLSGSKLKSRTDDVVERLQLENVYNRPIDTLSKGFKRRVGLAQAILLDPDILILDEPTDGLDPNQKHQVRDLLSSMAGDKVIVISTHILEEVPAICTRAIVIAKGRVLADESPADLQARSIYHRAVGLTLSSEIAGKAEGIISALPSVRVVEHEASVNGHTRLIALPETGQDPLDAVRDTLSSAGIEVSEIFRERGRLDDVFRQMTTASRGGV